MTTLFCPRCDRRLTPDHRCLSRRWFLAVMATPFVLPVPRPKQEWFTLTKLYMRTEIGYLFQARIGNEVLASEEFRAQDLPFYFPSGLAPQTVETKELVNSDVLSALR